MSTEAQYTDQSSDKRITQIVPLQPGAYHGLFAERDSNNSSRTTIGSMPVVGLALIEHADGFQAVDVLVADWEEGVTVLGELSNARGVCTAEELDEAKEHHGGGQATYRPAERPYESEKETTPEKDMDPLIRGVTMMLEALTERRR